LPIQENETFTEIEMSLSVGISLAIVVLNIIVGECIELMAGFELYSTITRQNISMAKKICLV